MLLVKLDHEMIVLNVMIYLEIKIGQLISIFRPYAGDYLGYSSR